MLSNFSTQLSERIMVFRFCWSFFLGPFMVVTLCLRSPIQILLFVCRFLFIFLFSWDWGHFACISVNFHAQIEIHATILLPDLIARGQGLLTTQIFTVMLLEPTIMFNISFTKFYYNWLNVWTMTGCWRMYVVNSTRHLNLFRILSLLAP